MARAGSEEREAEHRRKISEALRGRQKSPEHLAKIGAAKRGKPLSEEHRRKISAAMLGKRCGESSPHWSGDDVGYYGAHHRVREARGKATDHRCTDCGAPASRWSLSWRRVPLHLLRWGQGGVGRHLPYSLDLTDYDPRCPSCAATYDLRRVRREEVA
jgi:hypothetical protein